MFDAIACQTITFYQRYLSPYKGFRCAYHAQTGRHSCSGYAKKIIQRLGMIALLKAMPRQFARCRLAYHTLNPQTPTRKKRWYRYNEQLADGCCNGGCDIASTLADSTSSSMCDIGPCDCSL